MIDVLRYEGHTINQEWAYELHDTLSEDAINCLGPSDKALIYDAPIILEALLAAQARIAELEKDLTQPMLVNLSRLADSNADLKAKISKLEDIIEQGEYTKLVSKPREYTDDELMEMAR